MSSDEDDNIYHTPQTFSSSDDENSNGTLLKKNKNNQKTNKNLLSYYLSSCYGYNSIENLFENMKSAVYSTGIINENNDQRLLEIWERRLKTLKNEQKQIKIKAKNIKNNNLETKCKSELKQMMIDEKKLIEDINLCECMIEVYRKNEKNTNDEKDGEYGKIINKGKSKVKYVIETESLKDMNKSITNEEELKLLLEQRNLNKSNYELYNNNNYDDREETFSDWYEEITDTKKKTKKKNNNNNNIPMKNQKKEKAKQQSDVINVSENESSGKKKNHPNKEKEMEKDKEKEKKNKVAILSG